jgi:hypothetical protein
MSSLLGSARKQSILATHELCTCCQSEDVLRTARLKPSEKEKELHLKAFSLQNIEVSVPAVIYISNTDVIQLLERLLEFFTSMFR